MFSKDILSLICIKLDFENLLNFCLTSKEIYFKIFENNIFWMNKIRHDFNLIKIGNEEKTCDIILNHYVQKFSTNYDLFKFGIENENIDFCKIAYWKGLEYKKINYYTEIIIFLKYLMKYIDLLVYQREEKAQVIIDLYEKYLIEFAVFLNDNDRLWNVVLNKLEEFKNEEIFGIERYNKLINFYKEKI